MTIRSCSVVGAGVAARALAPALADCGVAVRSITGRNHLAVRDLARSVGAATGPTRQTDLTVDLVVLAVPDGAVEEVARTLRPSLAPGAILAHLAAALRPGVLGDVPRRAKMHPIVSLAGGRERLRGAVWGVEGDAGTRAEVDDLIRRLGGSPVDTSSVDLGRYHLAAVFASNFLLALMDHARGLWQESGVSVAADVALIPLARSAIDNWAQMGLPEALTGPIARGDVRAVEGQLGLARERGEATFELYRALAVATVDLAAARSVSNRETIAAFTRLLAQT